jgi:hydroxyacylglutathione hydrolase
MPHFEFHPIPAFKDNYIWAVIHKDEQTALIIDPGDSAPVIDFIENKNITLSAILITHHHADHRGGLTVLREKYSPIIYAPQHADIENPSILVDALTSIQTKLFGDFQVLKIPGHTLEHVAYYQTGFVFCGDTLFSAGCGRVFEGTYEQMYRSLLQLKNLPDDTQVYCAHEYTLSNLLFAQAVEPLNVAIQNKIFEVKNQRAQNIPTLPSTIGIEKNINPFLCCDIKPVIQAAESYASKILKTEIEVFTVLREWKNQFK